MARRPLSLSMLISLLVSGCALIAPLPKETTLAERLRAFPAEGLPLRGAVTVHWDDHQIPFIEAEHDLDGAFALGLVHAHLRLGQMEVYRRIAAGRIAEMGGPLAADIDRGLRILGFARAAEAVEAELPAETRAWIEAFVAGVNHYQQTARVLPAEFRLLGLEREPWTVRDVLALGRLGGSDVNWLVWFDLLRLRHRPDWPQLWARLVGNGRDSVPSFTAGALGDILGDLSRSGSNSLAVAPSRSRSGAALMANDPHLGISLPDLWLIAGLKSPSYHVVGLMPAGLPLWAIGRNPRIAWGGTNMRAAASELIDVSALPPEAIAERRETVAIRWWPDREVSVRETAYGPILTDAPQLEGLDLPPAALRWTGHRPSDEIGAMLRVARAESFAAFRAAFDGFAVPGQNMLYADADGNIGQVMAVRLPRRTGPPPDLILDPKTLDTDWDALVDVDDLPFSLNPEAGFLASANNRPTRTGVPVGWFFSPDDRMQRMRVLLAKEGGVSVADLEALQRDVVMPSARSLAALYVEKLDALGLAAPADGASRRVIALLRGWDGAYDADAKAPVAFELFRDAFTARFYETRLGSEDWAAFAGTARIRTLMAEDIAAAGDDQLGAALAAALDHAAGRLDDFADWGAMHRLVLAHPLGFLPLIGGRFRFGDYPVSGSTDTLMKTAHGSTSGRHETRYGSNARHISDLSDPDRNWFVLLGGQDGWFNSASFVDQVPLWRAGKYIQVPLRLESVRARFAHHIELGR